jgi:hypothetical protein
MATAAIADNDIRVVGVESLSTASDAAPLIEHWDGTSWTIISSPDPGIASNGLAAVTTLSDGTVVAVGHQQNSGSQPTGLIVEN